MYSSASVEWFGKFISTRSFFMKSFFELLAYLFMGHILLYGD